MKLKNESSRALTIAKTGQTVGPGEVVDVTGDTAKSLADQDTWSRVTTKAADSGEESDQ